MLIETKNETVEVTSVISTTISRNGKTYPALKFIFPGEVTDEVISELVSGSMLINGCSHDGYNTVGEISVTVGKITTAEAERDAMQAERDAIRAEHTETMESVKLILPVLDDETALTVKSLFPEWECGKLYAVGERFVYNDILYKVITEHTSQDDWTPDVATSLYVVINESHAGTAEDPIPYDGNMALSEGLYYAQNDVVYVCTRDTGNPVYNALSELVGLYVETAE